MKKSIISAAIAIMIAAASTSTLAHSGGTDAYGCHVDSSTGLRHCH